MSILVFPSIVEASVQFAEEARFWGRRIVGASSLEIDPNADRFDAWERLPFIGDLDFFSALETVVDKQNVTSIFTPHAATFNLLEQELPRRFPKLQLMGGSPFKRQMDRVRTALAEGKAGVEAAAAFSKQPCPLSVEFVSALLSQVETIYGECAKEKIHALCGIIPVSPKGDVVEIGSLFGKSSYVLNRIAAHCGIGPTLCIDPWNIDLSIQHDSPANIQQTSFKWDWDLVQKGFLVGMLGCVAPPFNYQRATSFQAFDRYKRGNITSPEFGTTLLAGKISVLHIDGNHDEAAVGDDFARWSEHLLPNGWIIFDDYEWPHGNGPRNVADRAIVAYGSRIRHNFIAGGAMFLNVA
jgi:hypothetical protein